jgi:hypothetical protein
MGKGCDPMTRAHVNIEGMIFHVVDQYSKKSEANKRAALTRRTGIFENVRVIETPKSHPMYKAKYSLCVRKVLRDPDTLSGKKLMRELGL